MSCSVATARRPTGRKTLDRDQGVNEIDIHIYIYIYMQIYIYIYIEREIYEHIYAIIQDTANFA